jgi:hypothetical protein
LLVTGRSQFLSQIAATALWAGQNSRIHRRSAQLHFVDQKSKKRPPVRVLEEGSLKVLEGLYVLVEQQQGQAEPSPGYNVPGVDCQTLHAIDQHAGNVISDLIFEPPDDHAYRKPSVEHVRITVVGLAIRIPVLIPLPGAGNVLEARFGVDLLHAINFLKISTTLPGGPIAVVKVGHALSGLGRLLGHLLGAIHSGCPPCINICASGAVGNR